VRGVRRSNSAPGRWASTVRRRPTSLSTPWIWPTTNPRPVPGPRGWTTRRRELSPFPGRITHLRPPAWPLACPLSITVRSRIGDLLLDEASVVPWVTEHAVLPGAAWQCG